MPVPAAADRRHSAVVASPPPAALARSRDEFPEGEFMEHVNLEIVKAQRISTPEGEAVVRGMVERHAELTGSPKAKQVLANWEENLPRFWQLVPPGEQIKGRRNEDR